MFSPTDAPAYTNPQAYQAPTQGQQPEKQKHVRPRPAKKSSLDVQSHPHPHPHPHHKSQAQTQRQDRELRDERSVPSGKPPSRRASIEKNEFKEFGDFRYGGAMTPDLASRWDGRVKVGGGGGGDDDDGGWGKQLRELKKDNMETDRGGLEKGEPVFGGNVSVPVKRRTGLDMGDVEGGSGPTAGKKSGRLWGQRNGTRSVRTARNAPVRDTRK